MRFSLILLTALAMHGSMAQEQRAEALLREGKPAESLDVLRGNNSPEASFWRGRALIELGRLQEAATALHAVPADHKLFSYAAKALLYCAWQSNSVDFAVIATPLATCENQEIATLATAALAEYWLRMPHSQDNTALERLRAIAETREELRPLLRVLEIDNLRLRGEYDKAMELCRELENDHSLPPLMRQRARLALSSVYYAKEGAEKQQLTEAALQKNLEQEQDADSFDDGKGEETLLHFISANPDSPLLEEAFRRLHEHKAFEQSEYARTKLREWMQDPLKSHRASIALLIQQRLQHPENTQEIPLDVSYANTAAATCPNEAATRLILFEQTRWFLERDKTHEALLYLGMIQGDDVVKRFYENQLQSPASPSTAKAYLECARLAPEKLRSVALENAMVSALISGDASTQEAVLNMPDISGEQHFSLLRARVAYWLDKDIKKAQADLDILLSQQAPSDNLRADVEMDQAYLLLQDEPERALDLLQKSRINETLSTLSDERQLRFFALQEAAMTSIAKKEGKAHVEQDIIGLIRHAAGKVHSPRVVSLLTLHMASLQTTEGNYTEALQTLNSLLRKYPRADFSPLALYMSARVSEFIGSMDSLNRAVQLYTDCATQSDELKTRSITRKAAVLLRLGHHEESEQILTHLLRTASNLRPQDRFVANAILANNKALLGTKAAREEAVEIASKALRDTSLPRWWRFRALLHHATLCSRVNKYEEALRDYEEVLSMKPAIGKSPSTADWHILYTAGAGAVMQLLHLNRYEDAAKKADELAEWNKQEANFAKRKQFSDWAAYIRQTNFLGKEFPSL